MRTLKQVAVDMANAFTRFDLWKGGGSGGGNVNAQIKELWSGQQSTSGTLTLLDDYSNYDVIVSQIEPLENYPTQQKYDFMLKGGTSLTGGMFENTNYITQYRLKDWNGTSVYFIRDTNPGGWNVTLRKIYGIKFINNLHEYSTEEKVVGKWIDGRNVYERVINAENITLQSYVWTNIYMIENMERIIDITCIIDNNEINDGRLRWLCSNNYICGAAEENNFTIKSCTIILKYIKTE